MNALFLKRFLQRPLQVASIIPSSKTLVKKVSEKMDFSVPRVIAEFGPGEGCHTREIVRRMHPDSSLLLFELDPELAGHLAEQFEDNPRITVLNTDAAELPRNWPSSIFPTATTSSPAFPSASSRRRRRSSYCRAPSTSLAPGSHSAFIIYQVTNELVSHCRHFPRIESEYCLINLPPMFVTKFYKQANGHHEWPAATAAGRTATAAIDRSVRQHTEPRRSTKKRGAEPASRRLGKIVKQSRSFPASPVTHPFCNLRNTFLHPLCLRLALKKTPWAPWKCPPTHSMAPPPSAPSSTFPISGYRFGREFIRASGHGQMGLRGGQSRTRSVWMKSAPTLSPAPRRK